MTAAVVLPATVDLRRYALVIVALTLLWVLIEQLGLGIAGRYALMQVVVMRYGMHLLLLAALGARIGPRRLLATSQHGAHIARGLCMFVMPLAFIIGGWEGLDSVEWWSTFWIAPFMIVVLSKWWLRERVGTLTLFVVPLGFAGTLLAMRGHPILEWPTVWPMISALSFSLYMVLSRKLRDETIESSLFYTSLIPFICMLPLALPVWQPITLDDVPTIAAIGVVGIALLALLDRSVELAPATFFGPCLYLAVVWEALVGLLVAGGLPSKMLSLGVGFLLAGLALQWRNSDARSGS